MTLSAAQSTAFQASGGFTPAAVSTVVLSLVFAVFQLWGVWALRTAFVSWAEHRMTQRQLLGVAVRFFFLYVALIFLLLS